ncbi:uncharacterized protein BDZ99DRAFT_482462 [Mytilinidion resinicola]|uniref:Secreted protein n=1 Tax=Mytilinidion resinicola TaxID=574789 RepID=A0A6A6Y294_9PEZI|nr:uncharacterized protein BDZ99DRAFT_482462 [Mytilinidion resinicola]KAF2802902.1 hypothetical protein BDZ99DRAFT_482462 [Mytilinidion resinicola]
MAALAHYLVLPTLILAPAMHMQTQRREHSSTTRPVPRMWRLLTGQHLQRQSLGTLPPGVRAALTLSIPGSGSVSGHIGNPRWNSTDGLTSVCVGETPSEGKEKQESDS